MLYFTRLASFEKKVTDPYNALLKQLRVPVSINAPSMQGAVGITT